MTFTKQYYHGVLFFFVCIVFTGCAATKNFGRNIENALGNAGREHVEYLGSPQKQCSLVKMRFSGAYAVLVPPKHIIRLEEEYSSARVAKQFSDKETDYAIIECAQEDGSLQNMLLVIPASALQAKFYPLGSTSDKPFGMEVRQKRTLLFQDDASPGQLWVWYMEDSGIRGPELVSRANLFGSANKPTQPQTPRQATPLIKPAASVQLDEEESGQKSAPATSAKQPNASGSKAPAPPVITIDRAPAPTPPLIVIDRPPAVVKEAEKTTE